MLQNLYSKKLAYFGTEYETHCVKLALTLYTCINIE